MQAAQTTLRKMIEGTHQYLVPLYQRAYSWKKEQWQALWDDLLELCSTDPPRTHFLGSIVTMQTTSVPEGVSKYLLIDGQQRLTTVFILMALLRDRARSDGETRLADEIQNTLLVNAYKEGPNYFRLMPTQDDQAAFQAIVHGVLADPKNKIAQAYRFFDLRLGSDPGVTAIKKAITENLLVVSILLESGDNPYLVFEGLNAKGEPLTQADLIRNFFFLKIHTDQQDEMHGRYWKPMQDALNEHLTEFIRHYLIKERGEFVRGDSVYFELKQRVGSGDALEELKALATSGDYYSRLLDPLKEPHLGLRESLGRLNRLEVTTAYPFLLHCYDEHRKGTLSAEAMAQIVGLIENFIVRRFVCNVPTNQLNKLFPPLFKQVTDGGFTEILSGTRALLTAKGYPKDAEFRARLIDAKLYGAGDRRARTRFLLESIEDSFGHKESLDLAQLNIEHLMPQTLSMTWKVDLGEDWEVTHQLFLDTLGNLTLTGYNPELSNQRFADKKGLLRQSHVEMNRYFEKIEGWDEESIKERGAALAEISVNIWPYFGDEARAIEEEDLVAKKKPSILRFLSKQYPVKTWRDVLETTLNAIHISDPEVLSRLVVELPKLISPDKAKFRDARTLECGLFVNVNLSVDYINRWCSRVLEVAEIAPEDWEVIKT